MTARDDFRQWEAELDVPESDGPGWVLWLILALVPLGCSAVIALGEVALGIGGLVVFAVIVVLWRSGM